MTDKMIEKRIKERDERELIRMKRYLRAHSARIASGTYEYRWDGLEQAEGFDGFFEKKGLQEPYIREDDDPEYEHAITGLNIAVKRLLEESYKQGWRDHILFITGKKFDAGEDWIEEVEKEYLDEQ